MKKFFSIVLIVHFPLSTFGQNVRKIDAPISGMLEVNGSANYVLAYSIEPGIEISGDSRVLDWVSVNQMEGITNIEYNPKANLRGISPPTVKIYYSKLTFITATGTSNLDILDSLVADTLTIFTTGVSEFRGRVICKTLNVSSTGTSEITLSGSTDQVIGSAAGSSELLLSGIESRDAIITATGASEATVYATESLTANAAGASTIRFKGNPIQHFNASGSSEIISFDANYSGRKKRKGRFENDWKDRFNRSGKSRQDLVWMGIDLGLSGYVTKDFEFQPTGAYDFLELNYARCPNVRLNFFEWRFNLVKNVFNIVTGMGIEWQHYSFDKRVRLHEAIDFPDQTFPTPIIGVEDTFRQISRSRLVVQSFCVPLFLNLRSKKTDRHRQQFNFSAGVIGAVRIGSNARVTYTEQGDEVREKTYDDFNLSLLSATAMVRIKYSFFSMYASYTFTPMFKNDDPGLRPFSIGVTFLSF